MELLSLPAATMTGVLQDYGVPTTQRMLCLVANWGAEKEAV